MKHKKLVGILSGVTVVILVVLSIVSDAAITPGKLGSCELTGKEKEYKLVLQWGGFGEPDILSVDNILDQIYVADQEDRKIKKFDLNGNLLLSWGGGGSVPGKFGSVHGLEVDPFSDSVYVPDSGQKQIHKFSKNGTFLLSFGDEANDSKEIATDSLGNVFTSSRFKDGFTLQAVVQKFTAEGVLIKKWDVDAPLMTIGSGPLEVEGIYGITLDSFDNVYVSVTGEIHKFNSEGEFIKKWDSKGSLGLAVDSFNNVYVSGSDKVYKYTSEGDFIADFATGFQDSHSVDVDSNGCVYVADEKGKIIRKFCPNKCATITVIKDVVNSPDETDFPFSINGTVNNVSTNFASFILDDDNENTLNSTKTIQVPSAPAGQKLTYQVSELVPYNYSPYSLSKINCVDPTNDTNTDIINSQSVLGRANIKISNSENIVCTFFNQKNDMEGKGKIIITKLLVGGPNPVSSDNNFLFETNFNPLNFSLLPIKKGFSWTAEKSFLVNPNTDTAYTVKERINPFYLLKN
ncbi:MAG: tripartite motif-containing protein 71, partial [Patescibacteria group bacterium]|nr:tripartite motif-containing protein 71 [Patescibacteria group bacterium]